MKIEGQAPTQGPDGRRFSASKSASPKEGGKSFGALLKKASDTDAAPSKAAPIASAHSAPAPTESEAPAAGSNPAASEAAPQSFDSHMEMVKLRLKSGYYNNTNVNDALSEKLTGFFDDLA
jgi:hypothetical protein